MYSLHSFRASRARSGHATSTFFFTLLAFVALVLSVHYVSSPPW
jgi:hypothetical protein